MAAEEIVESAAKEAVASFRGAGPWAVLAVCVVLAGGIEAHYFVSSFVDNTTTAIQALSLSNSRMEENLRTNRELIKELQVSSQAIVALLHDAQAAMRPAAEERKEQTTILREIRNLLGKQSP